MHRDKLHTIIPLFFGVLLPASLFAALAEDVWSKEGFFFDRPILIWFHSYASPGLDWAAIFMSALGYRYGTVPIAILLLAALLYLRRWKDSLFFALAVGGSAALNLILKNGLHRVRPKFWVSPAPETSFSFPSGHAMGSITLVTALILLFWHTRFRWPLVIGGVTFVLLVSASRLYLGVHFPSDILGAWAIGFAWVYGVSRIVYGAVAHHDLPRKL